MVAQTAPIPRGVVAGTALVAAAWAVLGALTATGVHEHAAHDALLGHGHHSLGPAQLLVFIGLWALMAIAMMLPSALPFVAAHADIGPGGVGRTLASTVAATVVVWTGFAVAALAGDAVLHELVESGTVPEWIQALLPALVLVAAGVFQLSPPKRRSLASASTASRPWSHAVSCLGSCWALMLVMFALGPASLVLMAVLTVAMVLEQLVRRGDLVASLAGIALIVAGLIVAVG